MIILDLPGGSNLISGGATGFGSADGMRLVLARIVAAGLVGSFVAIDHGLGQALVFRLWSRCTITNSFEGRGFPPPAHHQKWLPQLLAVSRLLSSLRGSIEA
jgi:hypothetical protein